MREGARIDDIDERLSSRVSINDNYRSCLAKSPRFIATIAINSTSPHKRAIAPAIVITTLRCVRASLPALRAKNTQIEERKRGVHRPFAATEKNVTLQSKVLPSGKTHPAATSS